MSSRKNPNRESRRQVVLFAISSASEHHVLKAWPPRPWTKYTLPRDVRLAQNGDCWYEHTGSSHRRHQRAESSLWNRLPLRFWRSFLSHRIHWIHFWAPRSHSFSNREFPLVSSTTKWAIQGLSRDRCRLKFSPTMALGDDEKSLLIDVTWLQDHMTSLAW